MIIDFMIALVVYDVSKFLFKISFTVFHKDKMKEEHKIQSEVKTFEEKLREKMEQNQND